MTLQNYRDLSIGGTDLGAGFQFEFSCSCCSRRWKSPFKPYRMGQFSGLLTRFMFLLPGAMSTAGRTSGNFSDMGSRGAKESALRDATALAERVFHDCPECSQTTCEDCGTGSNGVCKNCSTRLSAEQHRNAQQQAAEERESAGHSCPNCRTPSNGGRFCPECGFDMASTHKSCPGCNALTARSARFCTDCGHAF